MEIFTTTWNVISKIYCTTTIIISIITIILFCKMHVSKVISGYPLNLQYLYISDQKPASLFYLQNPTQLGPL